ncbi:peptide/nickel transport system substrate-binding protein [Cetobacterium ceti]|uniref:Peptide/nickel transport system substrate-binding protein n=1 Tax=Cetobacterium ceti TaxID=180163 RepID=A0A1T4JWU6_9FUSO|nr:glutathione ABC transporter substrate-binding protein [Cetobacterium ceti]SJZ34676.1 peptide/nickel transport system substrate-binding protein [Cetobacterium ceti]
MKKSKKILNVLATLCLASVTSLSAGQNPLVIAQGADAKTLDPHATNDQPSSRVSSQIYDRLVEQDLNMNIVPGLAEKWEQEDDLTTVFYLRKDVKFHNGEKLKASDVKFTLDRMKASPQVSHIIGAIDKVEVVDDYTVKVITEKPFGALTSHLSHTATSIMNEKAVKAGGDNYGQSPVGTGPYKFDKWDAGDRIVLSANENYFKGEAPTKEVIFRNIPEGTNRTIGLETNEVDIAYDIEPIDKDMIKSHDKLDYVEEPSLSMSYIGFNTEKAPLNDVKVRQAIAHAIDTDTLIDVVYQGGAVKANSPIGPKVFGYNKNAKAYEYNPEKAKAMLKEAGYTKPIAIKLWTNDNPTRRDIATIVQDQLKQIGVDVTIETLEWGAYLDGTARGDHDMFILGWVSVTGDADYGLYPLFHSSAKGGAGNRSFYSNEEVDNLLDKGKNSVDVEERKEAYEKVQEIVQEEVPVYTIAYTSQNIAKQKGVEGFHMHPAGHHKVYGTEKK